jgi:hypothetical protein
MSLYRALCAIFCLALALLDRLALGLEVLDLPLQILRTCAYACVHGGVCVCVCVCVAWCCVCVCAYTHAHTHTFQSRVSVLEFRV